MDNDTHTDMTKTEAMSPLADPVVEEIYKDISVAGLAAESFIGAVLAECGVKFGTVVELSPQKRLTQLGRRGCYIDVLAKSDTGNIAAQEIQLYFDPAILQRNLLGASYSYIGGARKGSTTVEMADEMADVSAINIFGHLKNCRTDNEELLQPIHFVYDKPPRNIAMTQFAVFNIQLPHFPKAPEDYSNPLYCWCKLLYEMHFNKKLPKEVFKMEPRIREFTEDNAGAAQFVSRYGEVAASPAVQQAYQDWVLADFREASIMRGVRMEGVESVARKMLQNGMDIKTIMDNTDLTREQIESLR